MRSNSPPSDGRDALRWARRCLGAAVESPQTEAEILVTHVLGLSRAELYGRGDQPLSAEAAGRLGDLVTRRLRGEPLQYLTGHQAFRRLDLAVGPGVLVPRPETEMLVEHALGRVAGVASPVVVDVGTGSGAIALSIAVFQPGSSGSSWAYMSDGTTMRKVERGGEAFKWGISSPTVAATFVTSGVGKLNSSTPGAIVYDYRYRYRNSILDSRSNPSGTRDFFSR